MSNVIKAPSTNPEVRTMALQMFQAWALAFDGRRDLAFLFDVYNDLKNGGTKFPPPPVLNAKNLLDTSTAPAWVDSDVCMRCRSAFTFTNRKHHCRNCGLVFDQACSSRVMPLPKFGIKEDVRVCESCWVKAGKNKPAPVVPGRTPRTRQDYDADLQRAIELSLAQSQPGQRSSQPPLELKQGALDDEDEQMRLAIEASLREMERANPSAQYEEDLKPLPTFDLSPRETETILTFSNTLDQMAAYGERDLRRFPHANILHDQAVAIGGKLQRNAEEKGTKAQMLYEMQAKLSEAIARYGQILDGQQAYAARKAQEAQHAQYQAYGYGYQPQQQGYYVPPQPHGYANGTQRQGYANGHYAPPQAQQPAPAHAAPSMYPSVPSQYQQQQYQPWAYNQPQPQQQQQWQPPSASRHASYSSPIPDPYANQYAVPSAPPATAAPAVPEPHIPTSPHVPSAPPIDLSPQSTTSALPTSPTTQPQPLRNASYSSQASPNAPLQSPTAPLQSPTAPLQSPSISTAPLPSPSVKAHEPWSQPAAAQHNPWSEPQQQQNHSQPQQAQQPPQQQQHWYNASMFPSAPQEVAAVPDLPDVPTQQPAQPKEALLIEL